LLFHSISVVASSRSKKCVNASTHRIGVMVNKVIRKVVSFCYQRICQLMDVLWIVIFAEHFCQAHHRYALWGSYLETASHCMVLTLAAAKRARVILAVWGRALSCWNTTGAFLCINWMASAFKTLSMYLWAFR